MKNPFKKSARAALQEAERHSDKMIAELEAATEALVQATEARVAASGQPDDVLDALDERYERAKKLMERARERLDIAGDAVDRAQAIVDAEVATEREEKAKALRAKLEPKIVEHYGEAARAILVTLRTIAQADAELAGLEVAAQAKSLMAIERGARFKHWLSEVEVSRQEVELWTDRHGQILETQPNLGEIGEDRDGHYLIVDGGRVADLQRTTIQKRKFARIEFKDDRLNRRSWVKPLAASLELPGIGDPDEPLWPPRAPLAEDPAKLVEQVEEALGRLADQLLALRERRDSRPVLVRHVPVQQVLAVGLPEGASAPASDDEAADWSTDDEAGDAALTGDLQSPQLDKEHEHG